MYIKITSFCGRSPKMDGIMEEEMGKAEKKKLLCGCVCGSLKSLPFFSPERGRDVENSIIWRR